MTWPAAYHFTWVWCVWVVYGHSGTRDIVIGIQFPIQFHSYAGDKGFRAFEKCAPSLTHHLQFKFDIRRGDIALWVLNAELIKMLRLQN